MDEKTKTLEELRAEWLERRLADKTIHNYSVEWKALQPLLSKRKEEVLRYLRKLSPKSHAFKITVWKVLLGKNHPFATQFMSPKIPVTTFKFLSIEEVRLLYENCQHPDTRMVIGLASFMGLRIGEILKLRHEDYKDGYLQVQRKGNKEQNLPVPAICRPYFKPTSPEKLIQSHDSIIGMRLNELGRKLFRKRVHAHLLRHTYASHLASKGVSIVTLKDLLGHSSLKITEKYLHVLPEHLQEARAASERIFQVTETPFVKPIKKRTKKMKALERAERRRQVRKEAREERKIKRANRERQQKEEAEAALKRNWHVHDGELYPSDHKNCPFKKLEESKSIRIDGVLPPWSDKKEKSVHRWPKLF